jgi:hypothetical protein
MTLPPLAALDPLPPPLPTRPLGRLIPFPPRQQSSAAVLLRVPPPLNRLQKRRSLTLLLLLQPTHPAPRPKPKRRAADPGAAKRRRWSARRASRRHSR